MWTFGRCSGARVCKVEFVVRGLHTFSVHIESDIWMNISNWRKQHRWPWFISHWWIWAWVNPRILRQQIRWYSGGLEIWAPFLSSLCFLCREQCTGLFFARIQMTASIQSPWCNWPNGGFHLWVLLHVGQGCYVFCQGSHCSCYWASRWVCHGSHGIAAGYFEDVDCSVGENMLASLKARRKGVNPNPR